jgi:integrase
MQFKLTETFVGRLRHKAERYDIRDTIERGLLMRVGKKEGSKQWFTFIYRGSKRQMVKLGKFPHMSLKEARLAAISAKATSDLPQAPEHINTVADLFNAYKEVRELKMRAWRDVQSAWDVWARDRIGHIRLTDITVHNGRDLRNHVTQKSSELRGSAIIRYIRPMFSWAAEESLIDINPWAGLTAGAVAMPRDRVLINTEWQSLWNSSFEDTLGEYFRFLMLSVQRKSNVATMRWDEIKDDIWTIPAEKFKATKANKARAHEVPLSNALIEIVSARPRFGEFVFGTTGTKPLSLGSREKDRIGLRAGVSNWRIHDLRRTGATRMTEGKVSRFIVERVLGHADRGVTAIYDRATYRDEKRAALETLSNTMLR